MVAGGLTAAVVAACATVGPHPPLSPAARTVRVEDGGLEQREFVAEAVAEVDAVWKDDAFWRLVAQRWWLPSVDGAPLCGKEVAERLQAIRPIARTYRIASVGWSRVGIHGRTTATTGGCTATTIDRLHMTSFIFMLNTVAHENTHSLGPNGETSGCASADSFFLDGDHGDETNPSLVSYGIGDLAECYVTSGRDESKVWSCFDGIVDGAPADRGTKACCPDEKRGEHLCEVRRLSARCRSVTCERAPVCVIR